MTYDLVGSLTIDNNKYNLKFNMMDLFNIYYYWIRYQRKTKHESTSKY